MDHFPCIKDERIPTASFSPHIAIIGGGAGGVFCAIETKRLIPEARVTIFEKSNTLLSKVRISGGGRCNVTHAQFDPALLSQNYPRGMKFLLPLFHNFQPKNTISWFEKEGVQLCGEEDGRMFPSTNTSETIISCFLSLLSQLRIAVMKNSRIVGITTSTTQDTNHHEVYLRHTTETGTEHIGPFDAVVVATGSTPASLEWITSSLGINLVPQVPSLFTFNCPTSPLLELSGVSVEKAQITLPELGKKCRVKTTEGPILITHWGFSGPAVLKLSAFCARELCQLRYSTPFVIDWAPSISLPEFLEKAIHLRNGETGKKLIKNCPIFPDIPKSLFERLVSIAGLSPSQAWSTVSNKQIRQLGETVKQLRLQMEGKTTYKNEFVTAGGIDLDEVSPKTMAAKKYPWLFFTGEVLDIDGVTGGFNFQAAWTTAWTAARGIHSMFTTFPPSA